MPDRQLRKRRQPPAKSEERPAPKHVADEPVANAEAFDAGVKPPFTDSGPSVEEQIRKEWDPKKKGGLPTSLAAAPR